MGKSLKGKELGIGITQRQDGLYQARFTSCEDGLIMNNSELGRYIFTAKKLS